MALKEIRKIFIMTLEATPNRKWGCLGALEARGFRMKHVHPIHGIDGLTYETHEEVIKAAAADGFGFFMEDPKYLERPIPMVAGTWSACRRLRDIADGKHTVLLMEDDWIFKIDFDEITKRLNFIDTKETEIAVLISKLYSQGKIRYEVSTVNDYWIAGAPASSACASVYSPAGAAIVLDLFEKHKATTLEKVVRGIEHPTAVTMLESIGHHPQFMGPSRANPGGTREGYVNIFQRWEKGNYKQRKVDKE